MMNRLSRRGALRVAAAAAALLVVSAAGSTIEALESNDVASPALPLTGLAGDRADAILKRQHEIEAELLPVLSPRQRKLWAEYIALDAEQIATDPDDELVTWLQDEERRARARIDQLKAELYDQLDLTTYRKVSSISDALALETAANNAYLCVAGIPCGSQGLGRRVI